MEERQAPDAPHIGPGQVPPSVASWDFTSSEALRLIHCSKLLNGRLDLRASSDPKVAPPRAYGTLFPPYDKARYEELTLEVGVLTPPDCEDISLGAVVSLEATNGKVYQALALDLGRWAYVRNGQDTIPFSEQHAIQNAGAVTHLVLVITKHKTICYQDGSFLGSFWQAAPIFSEGDSKHLLFGHYSSLKAASRVGHFPGQLLYARFFDSALTADQVAALAHARGTKLQEAGSQTPTGVLQTPPQPGMFTSAPSPSSPLLANESHSPALRCSFDNLPSQYSVSPEILAERLSTASQEFPDPESAPSSRPTSPYFLDARSSFFERRVLGIAEPSSSRFFGRESLLTEMRSCICVSEAGTFWLHGPPGIGKTKIAEQFVLANYQLYQAVFWVDATKGEASYTRIYDQLKPEGIVRLTAGDSQDKRWLRGIKEMVQWAFETRGAKRVLLVVDQLEDGSQLEELRPPVPLSLTVIVTTRLRESELLADKLTLTKCWEVAALSEKDELLLFDVTSDTSAEELIVAKDIIKGLRHVPFLLGLACDILDGTAPQDLLNQIQVRGEAAVLPEGLVGDLQQKVTHLRHAKASLPWWEKARGMMCSRSAARLCAWQIVMVAAFLNHNGTSKLLKDCVSRWRMKTRSYFEGILCWIWAATLFLWVLLRVLVFIVHRWSLAEFFDKTCTALGIIWMIFVAFGPVAMSACFAVYEIGSRPLREPVFDSAMKLVLERRSFASRQKVLAPKEDVYLLRCGLQAYCKEEAVRLRWFHVFVWLFPRELVSLAVMEELASDRVTCDNRTEPSFISFWGRADTLLVELNLNSQYHLLVIGQKLALYYVEAGGQCGRAVEVCERALKHWEDRKGAFGKDRDWSNLRWALLDCYTDGLLKRACSKADFDRALKQSQLASAAVRDKECQEGVTSMRMGFVHELRGGGKQARELYLKAKKLLNCCRPELARKVERRLAWVAHHLGDRNDTNAEAQLKKLHEGAEQAPVDSVSIATERAQAVHDLGHAAMWKCDLDEAAKRFKEALSLREQLFANPHPDTASSMVALVGVRLAKVSKSVPSCHVKVSPVVAGQGALLQEEDDVHCLLEHLRGFRFFSQHRTLHKALDMEYYLLPEGHRKVARTLTTLGHLWGLLFLAFAAVRSHPATLQKLQEALEDRSGMSTVLSSKLSGNELESGEVSLLGTMESMGFQDSCELEDAARRAYELAGAYLKKAYSLQRAVAGHHPCSAWTLHLLAQLNLDGVAAFGEAAMVAAAVMYARKEAATWEILENKGFRPFLRLKTAELLDAALKISNKRLANEMGLRHSVVMVCEFNQLWPEHCKPRKYTGEEERCLKLRSESEQFELPLPKWNLSGGGTIELWVRVGPGMTSGQVLGVEVKGGTLSLALMTVPDGTAFDRIWTLSLLRTQHNRGRVGTRSDTRIKSEMSFVRNVSRQKMKKRKSECEDICLVLVMRPESQKSDAAMSVAVFWNGAQCVQVVGGESPTASALANCTRLLLGPTQSAELPVRTLTADLLRVRLYSECLSEGEVAECFGQGMIREAQVHEEDIWTFAALGEERAGTSSPTTASSSHPEAAQACQRAAALKESQNYSGAIREYTVALSHLDDHRAAEFERVMEERARCYQLLGEHATYRASFEDVRGPAFVISMEQSRPGPRKDAEELARILDKYRFEVTAWRNPSMKDLREAIHNISREDCRRHDCLFIAVFAPGHTGHDPGKEVEILLATENSGLAGSLHRHSELIELAARAENFKGKPIIIVTDSTELKEPGFLEPAQRVLSNRLVSLFSKSEGPLGGFRHALWDLLTSSLLTIKGFFSTATWECYWFGQRTKLIANENGIYLHCHRLVATDEQESPFVRKFTERLAELQKSRLDDDIASILEHCVRPSLLQRWMQAYVGKLHSGHSEVFWRDGPPL